MTLVDHNINELLSANDKLHKQLEKTRNVIKIYHEALKKIDYQGGDSGIEARKAMDEAIKFGGVHA